MNMTRKEFLQLSQAEQNIFISKLLHAIRVKDVCFEHANWVVGLAEKTGLLDSVKFGNEVYSKTVKAD